MRKIIASILVIVTLFSFAGCSYRVKNEGKAEHVYTCPADNMFGLEKAVLFSDGMVLVFDKKASDLSTHVDFENCPKSDEFYGTPVALHDERHSEIHVRSSFVETSGKYVASAFFYSEEDGEDVVIGGMDLFGNEINVKDGKIVLSYDDFESVTDGYMVISQSFDISAGEWGNVQSDFVNCWLE